MDNPHPGGPEPAPSAMPVAAAHDCRPRYRYPTLLLRAVHRIDQDLTGADRPDLVATLLADHEAWLTPYGDTRRRAS